MRTKRDLFERTQFRLTLLYSGLLMLFLMLFIAVVYSILYATIYKDQERELRSSIIQEARNVENYLNNQNHRGRMEFHNQESLERNVDQFFYYIVSRTGDLVLGDEITPGLRSDILNAISAWNPDRNDTMQITFQVNHSKDSKSMPGGIGSMGSQNEFRPIQKTGNIRLLIAGEPIFYNGEEIGILYIGKEVSLAYQVFKWLLIILLGLAILFSVIAWIISHFMSKKAMVPITHAFSKQREFTADASHELRTPLSVMLSSIDALEMTLDVQQEDYSHKVLRNMRNEVKRMTGLVGDLLTLARSDSGTVELAIERFDFSSIAKETVESVRALAESKHIQLSVTAPQPLMVHGDPGRLTQLLYILLDNAIKYTETGGEAELSLSAKGHELIIAMRDTGEGIAPGELERIFERFYRGDKSRTRQAGGHGLGLPIAKWIVETHKGNIKVSSEQGKGSLFLITLPILDKQP